MTKKAKPDPALSGEGKLSALETELAKVTEDFRLAKLAAKEAKAYAKVVKKEMKRLRRAWVEVQDAQDKATATAPRKKNAEAASSSQARAKTKAATDPKAKRRVAGSPEIVRKPRRNKKQPALQATAANVTAGEQVAESTVAAANEPQLEREIPGTPVSTEE